MSDRLWTQEQGRIPGDRGAPLDRPQHGAVLPEYACAIISDSRRQLLLQLRPATARYAADQLTCFGGRREPGESTAECLHRELREELSWTPASAEPLCELWEGPRFIAVFFRATWDGRPLHVEPGQVAVWVPPQALSGLPVSAWHKEIIKAVSLGRGRVDL